MCEVRRRAGRREEQELATIKGLIDPLHFYLGMILLLQSKYRLEMYLVQEEKRKNQKLKQ